MRSIAIAFVASLCLASLAHPDSPSRLASAASEVVTLWRGERAKASERIAAGSRVRWEYHCEREAAGAPFAVVSRPADRLQRKLDDTAVAAVAACNASTGCCELTRGTRRSGRAYIDALCFDRDLHLVQVRETNEGACRG